MRQYQLLDVLMLLMLMLRLLGILNLIQNANKNMIIKIVSVIALPSHFVVTANHNETN